MTHRIRPVEERDNDAIYDICLRTADSGNDATHLYGDRRLPGHVWGGAYVAHQPEHAYVLIDDDTPVGYVLGARDSRSFEATLEREWWPPLRERYPTGVDRPAAADRVAVYLLHHPSLADERFVGDYPSHLHIDLLPEAQGRGDGRRMIEHLLDSLTDAGSPGVHLGVSPRNERAIGFYRTVGFTQLLRDEHHVLFGRRLG
ncbi:MAG: GNAT family N-acetyltransferase [Ilumatobacteraceae bacterium]